MPSRQVQTLLRSTPAPATTYHLPRTLEPLVLHLAPDRTARALRRFLDLRIDEAEQLKGSEALEMVVVLQRCGAELTPQLESAHMSRCVPSQWQLGKGTATAFDILPWGWVWGLGCRAAAAWVTDNSIGLGAFCNFALQSGNFSGILLRIYLRVWIAGACSVPHSCGALLYSDFFRLALLAYASGFMACHALGTSQCYQCLFMGHGYPECLVPLCITGGVPNAVVQHCA